MPASEGERSGPTGMPRGGQVVLGVLLVVVVVVVALVVWRRPGDDRTTVAIVGDSITAQGEAQLAERLSGEWRLRVEGRPGSTVAAQMPAAARLAEGEPSQVVVELGTNDVAQGRSPEQVAADLRAMVAQFPEAACIHLVTLSESMESPTRSLAEPAAAVNALVREMAAADARIDLVDWAALVRGAEQRGEELTYDTVHPTERGHEVLADAYGTALARCAGQGPDEGSG